MMMMMIAGASGTNFREVREVFSLARHFHAERRAVVGTQRVAEQLQHHSCLSLRQFQYAQRIYSYENLYSPYNGRPSIQNRKKET